MVVQVLVLVPDLGKEKGPDANAPGEDPHLRAAFRAVVFGASLGMWGLSSLSTICAIGSHIAFGLYSN